MGSEETSLQPATLLLLVALCVLAVAFAWRWWRHSRTTSQPAGTGAASRGPLAVAASREPLAGDPGDFVVGFVTNFFDTLGIGSFAPTTAIFKFRKRMADEQIPGTLNIGHALPTVTQALVFIAIVSVDFTTLIVMIAAAVSGAWLGAGVVTRLPRRAIQIGMGVALLVAALLFALANLDLIPAGGDARHLPPNLLAIAVPVNFALGALMTLGIGLYAPCLILCSLLGLNPVAAFPIMMGSCAFLQPSAGLRFLASSRYHQGAALGLTLGGIPAVLIAAYVVRSLPLEWLRWLVIVVVLIAAAMMLYSAARQQPTRSTT